MTRKQITLVGLILVISLSANAILPLAFNPIASLITAASTAARAPSIINAGKAAAWAGTASGKVATAGLNVAKYGGIFSGMSLGLWGATALVLEGEYTASGELTTSSYQTNKTQYYYYTGVNLGGSYPYQAYAPKFDIYNAYIDSVYSGRCITFTGQYAETAFSNNTNSSIYQDEASCKTAIIGVTYPECSSLASSEPDFSTPVEKEVTLLNDANGDYYNDDQGNRVPVYSPSLSELEQGYNEQTGGNYDFKNGLWDSVENKPADYQGLDYQQANNRANAISGTNDPDYLLNNDSLPERPDYEIEKTTVHVFNACA